MRSRGLAGLSVLLLLASGAGGAQATPSGDCVKVLGATPPTGKLPGSIVGAHYSARIHVTGSGGRVFWQLTGGALPPGLTLPLGGGGPVNELQGTLTAQGQFSFTLALYDWPTDHPKLDCLAGAGRSYTVIVRTPAQALLDVKDALDRLHLGANDAAKRASDARRDVEDVVLALEHAHEPKATHDLLAATSSLNKAAGALRHDTLSAAKKDIADAHALLEKALREL